MLIKFSAVIDTDCLNDPPSLSLSLSLSLCVCVCVLGWHLLSTPVTTWDGAGRKDKAEEELAAVYTPAILPASQLYQPHHPAKPGSQPTKLSPCSSNRGRANGLPNSNPDVGRERKQDHVICVTSYRLLQLVSDEHTHTHTHTQREER